MPGNNSQSSLHVSGISEIGPVREDNQDSIFAVDASEPGEAGGIFAIADGMGGYANGKMASEIAIQTVIEALRKIPAAPEKALRQGVEHANLQVHQAAQKLGAGRMGTTLTAAQQLGNQLTLVHVGDSRAYLVRKGKVSCLTNDHTTVGDLVRLKLISKSKVRGHAQRSILTKAIGLGLFIQPDLVRVKLQQGDWLILCSDGVWSVIEDEEFGALAHDFERADQLNQQIIDLALRRGTDDNASIVSVHYNWAAPHLTLERHRQKTIAEQSSKPEPRLWQWIRSSFSKRG